MDRLCVALMLLCVSSSQDGISGAEVELRVRPGDSVTLYCDCSITSGVYTVWYRNCSHENQPPLIISVDRSSLDDYDTSTENRFPRRFTPVWNQYNQSWDLLIEKVSESDLGIYYCGTKENKVVEGEHITQKVIDHYGDIITRLSFETLPSPPEPPSPPECGLCWILCPVCAFLSSLLSSACVFSFCRKTASAESQVQQSRTDTKSDSREKEEGDLVYTTVDIRHGSRRPKKKTTAKSSDFSTYAAINTSRV